MVACVRRCRPGRLSQHGEKLHELRWELIEVGLLGSWFGSAIKAKGKVEAAWMVRSQRGEQGAELQRVRADLCKSQWRVKQEGAIQV
jgi:hypothetical protein